jgi:60 kDa SS-A/Ro ribonucleoprotein
VNDPLTLVSTRRTPQSEPDPAVADRQKRNAAGGHAFRISDETKIHRFLTLGTTGGTFYTGEAELTKANTDVVLAAARDRGQWLAEQAYQVSIAGRAPKQNPAIFALAAVAGLGDEAARKTALTHLPFVCRTGTTLFLFATYVEQFRGWGRGLRRAVGDAWYALPDVEKVALQVTKYRNRGGWSHGDLLRLAHPKLDVEDRARRALFNWAVRGNVTVSRAPGGGEREVGATYADLPAIVRGFEAAQDVPAADLPNLVADYPLTWEMLPDASRTPEVWAALIRKGMPIGALLRQLPTLTRLGVLDDPEILGTVRGQLEDPERLKRGRIHPINVLLAMRTYASGHSVRGSSTWEPKRRLVDSLDTAFYAAYGAVAPANKRTLIALDVSGSMGAAISGLPLSAREAAAAISLVTLATEPVCDIVGFTASATANRGYSSWGRMSRDNPITELTISPRQRLDDVVSYTSRLDFGATDCALPMIWAGNKGRDYDTIIVITDSETWAGRQHPHQALAEYRAKVGHDVRQVVVGMTANDVSVADPNDPLTLDVAGFDSAVPNLIADFSRGDI